MFNNSDYKIVQTSSPNFFRRVYGWLTLQLVLTGIVAGYVTQSPSILTFIFKNNWTILCLILLKLLLVGTLSTIAMRLSSMTCVALSTGFSVLTGVTLASIFFIYTPGSIATAFVVSASMFGFMSIYGYVTNTDLSSLRSFFLMALVGLFVAGIVNMFYSNSFFEFIYSIAGVVIFTLLTAYDVQKLKEISQFISDEQEATKIAIVGALQLYLDFINLFLFLLRLFDRKRK